MSLQEALDKLNKYKGASNNTTTTPPKDTTVTKPVTTSTNTGSSLDQALAKLQGYKTSTTTTPSTKIEEKAKEVLQQVEPKKSLFSRYASLSDKVNGLLDKTYGEFIRKSGEKLNQIIGGETETQKNIKDQGLVDYFVKNAPEASKLGLKGFENMGNAFIDVATISAPKAVATGLKMLSDVVPENIIGIGLPGGMILSPSKDNMKKASNFFQGAIDEYDREQKKAIEKAGVTEDMSIFNPLKFGQAIGSGAGSIALAIATSGLTRSTWLASSVLGWMEGSDTYNEALSTLKEQGLDEDTAEKRASMIALTDATGITLLEKVGLDLLFRNYAGGVLYSRAVNAITETAQEDTQTVWSAMTQKYGYGKETDLLKDLIETTVTTPFLGIFGGSGADLVKDDKFVADVSKKMKMSKEDTADLLEKTMPEIDKFINTEVKTGETFNKETRAKEALKQDIVESLSTQTPEEVKKNLKDQLDLEDEDLIDSIMANWTDEKNTVMEDFAKAEAMVKGEEEAGPIIEKTIQTKEENQTVDVSKKSRFKDGEEIIKYIEKEGAGLGAQLNKDEMKQMVEYLSSKGDENKYVNLWGKQIERGTIYKAYGGGFDVVLGKVTDPRFAGDTVLVAQMNKNGTLDGRFRTHGSAIDEKDIVGKLGLEAIEDSTIKAERETKISKAVEEVFEQVSAKKENVKDDLTTPMGIAKDLIRTYVERGDSLKSLKDGQGGSYTDDYNASIGGYVNGKKINPDQIIITKIGNKEVSEIVSLTKAFNEIKEEMNKKIKLDTTKAKEEIVKPEEQKAQKTETKSVKNEKAKKIAWKSLLKDKKVETKSGSWGTVIWQVVAEKPNIVQDMEFEKVDQTLEGVIGDRKKIEVKLVGQSEYGKETYLRYKNEEKNKNVAFNKKFVEALDSLLPDAEKSIMTQESMDILTYRKDNKVVGTIAEFLMTVDVKITPVDKTIDKEEKKPDNKDNEEDRKQKDNDSRRGVRTKVLPKSDETDEEGSRGDRETDTERGDRMARGEYPVSSEELGERLEQDVISGSEYEVETSTGEKVEFASYVPEGQGENTLGQVEKQKDLQTTNKEIVDFVDRKTTIEKGTGLISTNEDYLSIEEKELIDSYIPAGGKEMKGAEGKGLLDEYYTPPEVVDMTRNVLGQLGIFKEDMSVLEPSLGIGNFIYAVPENAKITGFEINPTTAKITRLNNFDKQSLVVYNKPFESVFVDDRGNKKKFSEDYDLVIGNPPYGAHRGKYKGLGEEPEIERYEAYFIKRALDVSKEGGYVAMVVPSSFVRGSSNKAKELISKIGKLEIAYRFPNGIFNTTEIGTDLLVFKKEKAKDLPAITGRIQTMSDDTYFRNVMNLDKVLGESKTRKGQFGDEVYVEGDLDNAMAIYKDKHYSDYANSIAEDVEEAEAIETEIKEVYKSEEFKKTYIGRKQNEVIRNGEDYLSEEARGFKTAKDFIDSKKTFYHGTLAKFDKFDIEKAGSNTEWDNSKWGFFFLDDKARAEQFVEDTRPAGDDRKANIMEVKLNIKNPIDLTLQGILTKSEQAQTILEILGSEDDADMTDEEALAYLDDNIDLDTVSEMYDALYSDVNNKAKLQKAGYDGIISDFGKDDDRNILLEYVAFDTEQILTNNQLEEIWKKANKVSSNDKAIYKTTKEKKEVLDLSTLTKTTEEDKDLWSFVSATGELEGKFDKTKAYYENGKYYNKFNYLQGDIYEKLAQLDKDKEEITRSQYDKQKKALLEVLPEKVTVDRMSLSPNARFVHEFKTGPNERDNLAQEFLSWIDDLPREAFGMANRWAIRGYVKGDAVRGGDKLQNQEERKNRRIEGDRLFELFITENIEADLKAKIEDAYNKAFNSYYRPDYREVPLEGKLHKEFYDKELDIKDVQLQGIGFLVNKGVGLLAHDVGVGKTMQAIISNGEMIERDWAKKPLIVVPNINVYNQWKKEINELLPDTTINLLGNLGGDFKGDLATLEIADGTLSLITEEGFKRLGFKDETYEELTKDFKDTIEQPKEKTKRQGEIEKSKAEEEVAKGIKGTRTDRFFEDLGFDAITVDECFVKGTKILTPNGYSNIEDVKIGDKVINAVGVGEVTHTFKRTSNNLVKLKLSNGNELIVTSNHPFLTKEGWKPAREICGELLLDNNSVRDIVLEYEDIQSDMQNMQERISKNNLSVPIEIAENLFYTVWSEVTRDKFISKYDTGESTIKKHENENKQSNEESYLEEESKKYNNENGIEDINQRGEWKTNASSTKSPFNCSWRQLASRISNSYKIATSWLSYVLQNRYSKSTKDDSDRSGRTFTQFTRETKTGQKEDRVLREIRVESVEIYEQGGNGAFGQGIEVYNIEVSNHPSYVVADVVVHNCHNANHIIANAKADEGKSTEFRGFQTKPSSFGIKTWLATQYILKNNKNRNVFLLSATPFTNNPLEYYSILSLMARERMDRMGIRNVNDFMNMFMDIQSQYEFKANGDYVEKAEVRGFKNYQQFQKLLTEFIDFRDGEEAGVVRPNRIGKEYVVGETEEIYNLKLRAEELFKDKQAGTLKAINELRAIAFSPYLSKFSESVPTYKQFVNGSPKIKMAIELMKQNIKDNPKAGQLIYSTIGVEYFPLIKEYLEKEAGFKKGQVEIISGATPKNKRSDLQESFNAGEIKVIIGSDAIQEGVNLQKNTTDMYILSLPWNFTALRQVVGRAWRQGNQWNNLRVNNIFTENSIDIFLSQKLQNKEKRYMEALKFKGDYLDVGDVNFEELKFDLLTDPVARVELETKFKQQKLENDFERIKSDIAYKNRRANELLKAFNDVQKYKAYVKEDPDTQFYVSRLKEAEKDLESTKITLRDKGFNVDDIFSDLEKTDVQLKEITEKIAKLNEEKGAKLKQAEKERQDMLTTARETNYEEAVREREEENIDFYVRKPGFEKITMKQPWWSEIESELNEREKDAVFMKLTYNEKMDNDWLPYLQSAYRKYLNKTNRFSIRDIFSLLSFEKKITKEEAIEAIRKSINAEQYVSQNFNIKFVQELIDGISEGSYSKNNLLGNLIKLYEKGGKVKLRVALHESKHHIFQYLPKSVQEEAYEKARKEITPIRKLDLSLKYSKDKNTEAENERIILEEYIVDKWAMSDASSQYGYKGSTFYRVYEALDNVLKIMLDVVNQLGVVLTNGQNATGGFVKVANLRSRMLSYKEFKYLPTTVDEQIADIQSIADRLKVNIPIQQVSEIFAGDKDLSFEDMRARARGAQYDQTIFLNTNALTKTTGVHEVVHEVLNNWKLYDVFIGMSRKQLYKALNNGNDYTADDIMDLQEKLAVMTEEYFAGKNQLTGVAKIVRDFVERLKIVLTRVYNALGGKTDTIEDFIRVLAYARSERQEAIKRSFTHQEEKELELITRRIGNDLVIDFGLLDRAQEVASSQVGFFEILNGEIEKETDVEEGRTYNRMRKDINLFEQVMAQNRDLFLKDPNEFKAADIIDKVSERRKMQKSDFDKKLSNYLQTYFKLKKNSRSKVDKILYQGDQDIINYPDNILKSKNLNAEEIEAYKGVRKAFDIAHELLLMKLSENGVPPEEIRTFRDIRGGYIPHKWKYRFVVKTQEKNEDGLWETKSMEDFKSKKQAIDIMEKSNSENKDKKNVRYIADTLDSLAVDFFSEQGLSFEAMKGVINNAKTEQEVKNSMIGALRNMIKEKGFGRQYIKRTGIEGYNTDNLRKDIADYFSGLSGFITKLEASKHYYDALNLIDPRRQQKFYEYARTLVAYEMGNSVDTFAFNLFNTGIRIDLKNLAFMWYLANDLSFLLVNATQNFTIGVGELSKYVKGKDKIIKPEAMIMKAMFDWSTKNVTADEMNVIKGLQKYGRLGGDMISELMGFKNNPLYQQISSGFNKVMYGSTAFVESNVNRIPAFLAARRLFIEQGMTEKEANAKALDVSEDIHFRYGKVYRPALFRGRKSLIFVFMTYARTYLYQLYRDATKKEFIALTRKLMYTMALGGATSLPLFGLFKTILSMIMGADDDDEIKKEMGLWETIFKKGLPAGLTGIDLSGRVGVDIMSVNSILEDPNNAKAYFGAIGNFIWVNTDVDKAGRLQKAVELATQGRMSDALGQGLPDFVGNIFKAYSGYTYGVRTFAGTPLEDKDGNFYKYNTWEAIVKGIGFTPVQESILWNAKNKEWELIDQKSGERSGVKRKVQFEVQAGNIENAREIQRQARIDGIIDESTDYVREYGREIFMVKAYDDYKKEVPLKEIEKDLIEQLYGVDATDLQKNNVRKDFAVIRAFGPDNKLAKDLMNVASNDDKVELLLEAKKTMSEEEYKDFLKTGKKEITLESGKRSPILISESLEESLKEAIKSPESFENDKNGVGYKSGDKDTEEGILDTVLTYAKAFGVDPLTAFNRVFTNQRIRKIDNNTIIIERNTGTFGSPTYFSSEVRDERGATDEMRLDHTIPVGLGGADSEENVKLISYDEWKRNTPVEIYLIALLKDEVINKKKAQTLIADFKSGKISADEIYAIK